MIPTMISSGVIFIEKLKPITAKQDAKLDSIVNLINTNKDETGKVIIFTEFMTTARYLKKHLMNDSNAMSLKLTARRKECNHPCLTLLNVHRLIEGGEQLILISTDVLAERSQSTRFDTIG